MRLKNDLFSKVVQMEQLSRQTT